MEALYNFTDIKLNLTDIKLTDSDLKQGVEISIINLAGCFSCERKAGLQRVGLGAMPNLI